MCRGAPMYFSRYTSAELNAAPASFCACANSPGSSSLCLHDAHAAPAAAGRRLQNHRIADLLRQFQRFLGRLQHPRRSRQHRHARLAHERAGLLLHAHQRITSGPGTDELDAGRLADFGEVRVLAQEAVARMDRVDVGDLGRADDRRNVQVAAGALGRSDADRLVGEAHVRGVAVGLGIDGDGLNPQFLAGANDANRDFAAVGDEDLFKPVRMANSASPYSTGWPFITSLLSMMPECSASISFISFIDSMMQSTLPGCTVSPA